MNLARCSLPINPVSQRLKKCCIRTTRPSIALSCSFLALTNFSHMPTTFLSATTATSLCK